MDRTTSIKIRKAVALVAYLAVEKRSFSREFLATLFWPDLGTQRALANLRQTLSIVRGAVGSGCVVTESDMVQLNYDIIHVDIDEFRALSSHASSDADLDSFERAASLYRGSFLEGFNLGNCLEYDRWQADLRQSLESQLEMVLETLAASYVQLGRPQVALPYARRWVGLDHWNEAANRSLMEIFALTGGKNAARKQYESLTQMLAGEDMEPEELTRQLYDNIIANRVTPLARTVRRHRRLILYGIAIALAGATIVMLVPTFWRSYSRSDLAVEALDVLKDGDEFAGVRVALRNQGFARRKVRYTVVFSKDQVVGTVRDFVVYSATVNIGRNSERTIEISGLAEIQAFVDGTDVKIPPGDYYLGVFVDPEADIAEQSEFNNRLSSDVRFFYRGAAAVEVFAVDIQYGGDSPLDEASPLKIFIGDRTGSRHPIDWGLFEVANAGQYYFPLTDIPGHDVDGTGYFMLIVRDFGNNLLDPFHIESVDVTGLYKEVVDNVVYGAVRVGGGTPVFPGGEYRITLSPPPSPAPDAYEMDDRDSVGTVIEYADLPVRQYHTFHDEGSGDTDYDWFRIFIKSGDSVRVETYSADGLWESDTAIDFKNSEEGFLGGNRDKAPHDSYSRLTYVNDTGVDQEFQFLVKIDNQYNISSSRHSEYIVEFGD